MKAATPEDRRFAVISLVNVWLGGLSPNAIEALGTHDTDDLIAKITAVLDVVISRGGNVPGMTHASSETFAAVRQDLHPSVEDGLKTLALSFSMDAPVQIYDQADPIDVARLLFAAADHKEQRVKIADMQAQPEETP